MSKAALKADNHWHEGIIFYIIKDGKECVAMTPDESSARSEYGDKIIYDKGRQLCRYNWNHGQMQVELRNGDQMSVVDSDWVSRREK